MLKTTNSFIETNDFNLNDDLHNGQIYLIKNKINEKCYIGQALCFVGNNNSKWGTIGRWKSHIREATKSNQDHCILLNNAIRKYGEDGFDVLTLVKSNRNNLNELEIKFIQKYNSIQPNGYNIKEGGYNLKNSEETILKMKESHYGKEHSEETKDKIGKTQIGNRRGEKKRIYDEDNNLPKYIVSSRRDKILKGYIICRFPIGIKEKEYLKDIMFSIAKYGTKEKCLEEAIICLNNLKKKYLYIDEEVKILKETNLQKSITEKIKNKVLEKLPENIYPIIEENKINGYYVDNIFDNKGKKYPKRIFNENTNRWNLDKSKKFVEILKYINNNNVILTFITTDDLEINDIEKSFYQKYYLPMYFNILKKKGEIIGFCINGYPSDKHKDSKYKKEYRLKTMKGIRTLEETYLAGIEDLHDLKKGYITI